MRRIIAVLSLLFVRPNRTEVARAVYEPHYVDFVGVFNLVDNAIPPDEELSDLRFAHFWNYSSSFSKPLE